jgi:hypothetical protein
MTRRFFLRGLGATTLAIPFLPSLAPRQAAADPVKPPRRFAMTLTFFGRDMFSWYPKIPEQSLTQVPGAYYAKLSAIQGPISYTLGSAFDPIRNKLSVIRGLDDTNQNWAHNNTLPSCGSSLGNAYSIDAVLEKSSKFYATKPSVGALRLNPATNEGAGMWSDQSTFSYDTDASGKTTWVQSEWDPKSVYNKYFNQAAVQEQTKTNNRVRSVTNAAYENFRTVVNGRRIGASDKKRLEDYMSLISQIDAKLAASAAFCAGRQDPGSLSTAELLNSAMFDMAVAALACGMTNIVMHVISFYTSDPNGSQGKPDYWYHQVSHDSRGLQAPDNPSNSLKAAFDKWQMGRVAELLTKLDSVAEFDGSTLLDNTLFIHSNEDGNGSHFHVDVPVLVAGGQGKLKTGYFIDFRPRPIAPAYGSSYMTLGRPYNALLVTAFKALGLSEADYQLTGTPGFGKYDQVADAFKDAYAPFLGPHVDDPLPFLYNG